MRMGLPPTLGAPFWGGPYNEDEYKDFSIDGGHHTGMS